MIPTQITMSSNHNRYTAKPIKRPDPLSPAGISRSILARLLKPEALRQQGVWGRELKVLSRLRKSYPDESFWLNLRPHEKLDSLLYLTTDSGQSALREFWAVHQMEQGDLQNWIDKAEKRSMMGESEFDPPIEETPVKPDTRRMSPAAWADKKD